jgi:hypothetical protein
VTTPSEPSWFNSRVASAGPTPGNPWSMKIRRDVSRLGFDRTAEEPADEIGGTDSPEAARRAVNLGGQ